MPNRNRGSFYLCFCEFFEFSKYGRESFFILGIVVLSSRYIRDFSQGFLVQSRTNRFPCLITKILFLAESISYVQIRSCGIADSECIDLNMVGARTRSQIARFGVPAIWRRHRVCAGTAQRV